MTILPKRKVGKTKLEVTTLGLGGGERLARIDAGHAAADMGREGVGFDWHELIICLPSDAGEVARRAGGVICAEDNAHDPSVCRADTSPRRTWGGEDF